jgi:hypothetical protein
LNASSETYLFLFILFLHVLMIFLILAHNDGVKQRGQIRITFFLKPSLAESA